MTTQLLAVTFDCSDAAALGEFWAQVLGEKLDEGASPAFASIGAGDADRSGPRWYFAQVPESKTAKNRMHPDLTTATLDEEVARLLGLGATKKAEVEMGSMRWITLADPEGNEFDLIDQPA